MGLTFDSYVQYVLINVFIILTFYATAQRMEAFGQRLKMFLTQLEDFKRIELRQFNLIVLKFQCIMLKEWQISRAYYIIANWFFPVFFSVKLIHPSEYVADNADLKCNWSAMYHYIEMKQLETLLKHTFLPILSLKRLTTLESYLAQRHLWVAANGIHNFNFGLVDKMVNVDR